MNRLKSLLLLLFISSITGNFYAQELTQSIRGTIVDKISQTPLPGATIVVLNSDPVIGTTSDMYGNFKLIQVPVGTQSLEIAYLGYKERVLQNLVINSGKEMVLTINLEEDFKMMNEVEIKAELAKNKPLNEMATVSARSFSVEETQKFAAAVNDPARMVTAYAGVVQADDGNNGISIRGNTPNGLLWRMEGVDIPNPNHYANTGSSGGGISIISSQLLTNSDFMTGAFPAEYGNALSGVFDLKLRKGNNEKHEHTIQAGVLGIDVATEGPFAKGYNGSYLINYRYSTLSVLRLMGLDIMGGTLDFQDVSFNIHLPAGKAGNFSLFGFGGLSSQKMEAEKDSILWREEVDLQYNENFFSNTGAAGLKHGIVLNANAFLQTSLVASGKETGYEEEKLDNSYNARLEDYGKFIYKKLAGSSVLSYKLNSRIHSNSGIYVNQINYDVQQKELDDEDVLEQKISADGTTYTTQAFTQWSLRATEKLTFNAGVHFLYLGINGSNSTEPRASVKYDFSNIKSLSFGYGLHSQIQPIGNYFFTVNLPNGSVYNPNKKLDLTKSHHFVLSYSQSLNEKIHAKVEAYYQHLFDIPVSVDPNSRAALINQEWGFATEAFVNEGIGHNYGLEFTLEQFMHKDLYYLFSASLYNSEFRATDGNWYNTRFNGNYAFSFTGGKEFRSKNKEKQRVYGVNIKAGYSGGFRTTPIDLEQSRIAGEAVYIEDETFEDKLPDYFRTDVRFSMKTQRESSTHTLSLDIQNVSNRQNVFNRFYDAEAQKIDTFYQVGILPVLSYRIEF